MNGLCANRCSYSELLICRRIEILEKMYTLMTVFDDLRLEVRPSRFCGLLQELWNEINSLCDKIIETMGRSAVLKNIILM